MFLGVAIAEICSAYPSAGGLYSASGLLVPRKARALTAWITGSLNILGQLAGIAGTEYGLSQMIWAYAYVANGYVAGVGATVGLYIALREYMNREKPREKGKLGERKDRKQSLGS